MTNELTDTRSYQKLRDDLATLLQQGQQEALAKLNEIRIKIYWDMGKRLNAEKELVDSTDAGTFMNKLADDLNLEVSLLYRILQFYRTWPNEIPTGENIGNLSWAHYVEVLSYRGQVLTFSFSSSTAKCSHKLFVLLTLSTSFTMREILDKFKPNCSDISL